MYDTDDKAEILAQLIDEALCQEDNDDELERLVEENTCPTCEEPLDMCYCEEDEYNDNDEEEDDSDYYSYYPEHYSDF